MNFDDLFNGGLDSKMSFLNEKQGGKANSKENDGIYRIDMALASKETGWRSVLRFLPNVSQDGQLGECAIEKISHYVDIKEPRELSGYFDSPKNFGKDKKCYLSDLYYQLDKSNNALLKEKAKSLKYSKKYYSYVMIMEDPRPELVGKIMLFQFGKTIYDKIKIEENGEVSGEKCNIYSLDNGKDFVLMVKEIKTGNITYPDYKQSTFKGVPTSLPVYSKENNVFKHIPLVNGKVDPKYHGKIKQILLDRTVNVEDFAPKPLTEDQQAKISEITNFLLGKSSQGFVSTPKTTSSASSEDFDFDNDFDSTPGNAVAESISAPVTQDSEEDDFFSDLD